MPTDEQEGPRGQEGKSPASSRLPASGARPGPGAGLVSGGVRWALTRELRWTEGFSHRVAFTVPDSSNPQTGIIRSLCQNGKLKTEPGLSSGPGSCKVVQSTWKRDPAAVGFCVPCCLVTKSCLTLCDPMTVAHQAPLSLGFPRQEHRSELLCACPGTFPTLGLNSRLLHWQEDSLPGPAFDALNPEVWPRPSPSQAEAVPAPLRSPQQHWESSAT